VYCKITHLDLMDNSIGDEGAKAIANSLATSKITHLGLQYNDIGAEGAKAIANSLATSKISNNARAGWPAAL
jgi:Ran GTPase-activating protein (RanGAP) involved in mRNA processing and transport